MICDKDGKISSNFGFPGARNSNVFLYYFSLPGDINN